jgi:hypothetical protein
VFEIQAAADDIEICRSDLADQMQEYDIDMQSCIIQQVGSELLEATQAAHDSTMHDLRAGKLAADLIATTATAVKDCCAMLDVIKDALTFGARFAVGCTAVGIAAAATGTSQGLAYAMEEAQAKHDSLMASIEHEIEDAKCFNDAEVSMVDADTVALRIGRATTDLYAAQTRFNSLKAAVRADWDDGRAALAAARGRYVAPLAHDLWIDEAISTFLRDLRLSRRILYLAVRAVEYETQQSLDLAGDVLTARTPAELQAVLDTLWTTSSTRNVGGARPSDLKVVLSMRDELLQLADQSDLPEAEQQLSDVERFRLMLRSPRYAVYDDAGTYLGQQVPFTLAPLGVLGLADPQGIPILAATDCAERLWSVNASILGGEALYEGATPPTFTRIDLLKRNTFYSQWCGSSAETQFQVGAVRPSRNLFRDPVAGGDYGEGFGPENEQKIYSRARIEAYFNVERADFEADDYANGDTAELAARGLYGDYALFIPAGVLSIDGSDGLVLNQVDDILLRLDYVSVAR